MDHSCSIPIPEPTLIKKVPPPTNRDRHQSLTDKKKNILCKSEQLFPLRDILLMSRDIHSCHSWGSSTIIYQVEERGTTKAHIMYRHSSTSNYATPRTGRAVGQRSWCRPNPRSETWEPMCTPSQAFLQSSTVLSWCGFSLLCLLPGCGSSLIGWELFQEHYPFDAVLTHDLCWTWIFRWELTHEDPHSHNCNLIVAVLAVRTFRANLFILSRAC